MARQVTQRSFAKSLLKQLGIRPHPAAVKGLVAWERAEGGHFNNTAHYNPLNTTQNEPGASSMNSVGVKAYPDWRTGLNATVQTLENGRYSPILRALKQGSAQDIGNAIGQTPWGTGAIQVSRLVGGGTGPKGRQITGNGGVGGGRGPHQVRVPTTKTTSKTVPGVDNSELRKALLANYLMVRDDPTQRPAALAQLALGLQQAQDIPTKTVTQTKTASRKVDVAGTKSADTRSARASVSLKDLGSNPAPKQLVKLKGVTKFEGKPVADWISPILQYARQHGWKGTVTSGWRSDATQKRIYDSGVRPAAVPQAYGGGGSNHEFKAYPGGAVDVSDAATLSAILSKSPYANLLVWAGSKDPVHFSHPHNGSY